MKPLTIEELKALEVGDWVWVENLEHKEYSLYAKVLQTISGDNLIVDYVYGNFYPLEHYSTKWLAYKNKEQAECKGETVELPCLRKQCNTMYQLIFVDKHNRVAIRYYSNDLLAYAEARLKKLRGVINVGN